MTTTSRTSVRRELPAVVYDTLYLVGVAYGGFGAGRYTTDAGEAPLCIYGAAAWCDDSICSEALVAADWIIANNDALVVQWRVSHYPQFAPYRMPVDEYFARAGFVRGA